MIGLTGARVIIVDDEEHEAIPILKALARQGISAAFFDGRKSGFPGEQNRLKGVRLAILDMDIIGASVPEVSRAAALVNVLRRIVSPDNGPYGVLAWTKHPEMVTEFETYLFKTREVPPPVFAITIEKSEFQTRNKVFKMAALAKRVDQELAQYNPLLLLQAWEGQAIQSASDVSNSLSRLAEPDAPDLPTWKQKWKTELQRIIHTLAEAEAGLGLDKDGVVAALYRCMNPLQADRMESYAVSQKRYLRDAGTEVLGSTGRMGPEQKARLNTLLHLSFDGLTPFAAGNIYMLPDKPKPHWIPNARQYLEEIIQRPEQDNGAQNLRDVESASLPVLMEVSASCDHAQNKVRIAHLMLGYVVPFGHYRKLKKLDSVWRFGPVFLQNGVTTPGAFQMFFSAQHVAALDVNRARRLRPFVRIRSQAFVDMQAWLAHHVARPGMLLLTER